ncbi:zinc finger MYM-type protein 4-like isoform X2 [Scyliorhinus canicula]|uniref:zinc finger MYM-type protein 4-like isoform X2 n=1 Tax=Scyliorhinus canicula TaxID=7830 RepID=UPI0018F30F66|nr:zinc finger MYM-type protein 4-like isoform X2 [Scyliorhinus canicula]
MMANINASEEISVTIQQIKEGPKAKLRELCKQYGLPVSGTRVYFQRVLCQRLGIDPKSVIIQKPTSRSNSHGDCCSVAGCRSRRGKDTHIRWFTVIRKKGSHTAAITKAIQFTREGWTPTMYSRICGQHFSCGQLSFEPTSPDYIPHLHMDPIAKASTPHSTFWLKDSSEQAMDLTNKSNIKTSSAHIAGPSRLDFTNRYASMNSSVRALLLSTPEGSHQSETQEAESKPQTPFSSHRLLPSPWQPPEAEEHHLLSKGVGYNSHYPVTHANISDQTSVTARQVKEGSKGKLRDLCRPHGFSISGNRPYFQRFRCQKFGLIPKAMLPVKKPAAKKVVALSTTAHESSCCIPGCPNRHGKDSHVRWFAVIRESEAHTASLMRAIRFNNPGWTPTFHSKICGQHFFSGQISFVPGSPDYVPHLNMSPTFRIITRNRHSETECRGNLDSVSINSKDPSICDSVNEDKIVNPPNTEVQNFKSLHLHRALKTRNKDDEYLGNTASPGTWEEDGDASEDEMGTEGGWQPVPSRDSSEALDFSATSRAKAERRLELSVTVNESGFGQGDSFGRQSDVFNNEEQTLLHRGHRLLDEDENDYLSSNELVAVPLGEDDDNEIDFDPVNCLGVQHSQSNQTTLSNNFEEGNGVQQGIFIEAEEKRRKSELDELKCRKQSIGSKPDEYASDSANNFEKDLLSNDCDGRFDCEDGNQGVHQTILSSENEDSSILHKTELFNIAENGNDILRAGGRPALGVDEKAAALSRKAIILKESVGFPMKRSDKKDFMSETRPTIKDSLPTVVDSLLRGSVEGQTEILDKGRNEKNREVTVHEDLSADETQEIDDIESEASITTVTASPVEKSLNSHRHTEALKSTPNSSFMPGMKIKDEPLDEGYEKALAPQDGARIKDEPDFLQAYGQHSKPQESDIRISAVFSVSGSPLVSQLVQPNTPNTLGSAKSPAGGSGQPASTPMSVRVTCSGCKKILKKGQTAYQRKGSTQLFCSTLCLTGLSASAPRPAPPPKKSCHLCNKEIMNLKDLVMGQIDGRGPYKEFCNHNCLFEMKRKSASTTNNITTKCSICQKVSVVRHEVNYQNVVHQLCSDVCFSKFRMANNLTMNCCDNCGAYCYSGSAQCHMLQTEGQCKKFCGSACLSSYKQKNSTITPCAWCKCLRSSAEMIENTNSFGKAELFCSVNCLSAFRVHVVTTQGTSVQCNYCKVTMTPQYHLAMSDGSIRNFCSYNCVASFQGLFSQAAPGSQTVVPLSQGQLAVNIPSTASVVAGAPVVSSTSVTTSAAAGLQRLAQSQQVTVARTLIRLRCQYCQRLFSSKPELLEYKGRMAQFCGKSCCDEYKRINSVVAICEYCRSEKIVKETVKFSSVDKPFCSEGCKLLYKHDLAKRWGLHCKSCSSCSQSSKRLLNQQFGGKIEEFCSEECLFKFTVLFYQMAKCDCCKRQGKLNESIKWHGQIKHFCNLHCVLTFCNQHHQTEMAPQDGKVTVPNVPSVQRKEATPVIATVMSLANTPPVQNAASSTTTLNAGGTRTTSGTQVSGEASTQTEPIRLQPAAPPKVLKNKALLCKPMTQTKATSCRPHTQTKACQTEEDWKQQVIVLPIPVPVYIPVPLHLYSQFTPLPIGMPVPLPVPMFIPTTLDSADRIIETIQEIKEKIPSNPFEADLLTMAAMIAEEEEKEKTVSYGDQGSTYSGDLESEAVSTPHSWEDELSNFTLKQSVTSAPLPPPPPATEPEIQAQAIEGPEDDLEADISIANFESSRRDRMATARQNRAMQRAKNKDGFPQPRKRGRKKSIVGYTRDVLQEPVTGGNDVGLFLKYMYGVKAWKTWVQFRNDKGDPTEELRFGSRPIKLKEDILSCTAAELSYGLCQFIREVRRPNGNTYEPDSIFYLCLGIQQYIFENSRIDNIFTDLYYTKFTSELTKALKVWQPQLLPNGQLFCRIEEEHLWECKQLGAYSPTVLLNTLLFFNTKYFQLKSVSDHMKLSFAHLMRCTKSLKQKLTYLRFFPPMFKKDKDTDKLQFGKRKRSDEEEEGAMEIAENTDNPLRCPVRLFEFYLSKCSESVKSRSDVFYLQPERSCVPDSPMWYSTLPTDPAILDAMLTRILMVREVHEELAKVNHEDAEEEDAFE